MQLLIKKISFVTVLFVLMQCNNKYNRVNLSNPEAVAVAFVRAGSAFDFIKAGEFADDDLKEVFEAAQTMAEDIPAAELEKAKKNSKLVKKADCIVKGNLAECTVCCDAEGQKSPQSIHLKKIDGHWLVYLNKEDSNAEPNY